MIKGQQIQELKQALERTIKRSDNLYEELKKVKAELHAKEQEIQRLKTEFSSYQLADLRNLLENKKIDIGNSKESKEFLEEVNRSADKLFIFITQLEEVRNGKNSLFELEEKKLSENDKLKNLTQKIEKFKQNLEKKKNELLEKLKKAGTWSLKNLGRELIAGDSIEKRLERILKAQVEIIRYNSSFAEEAKEKLLGEFKEELPNFSDELFKTCQEQSMITALEIQLDGAKKISKVVDTKIEQIKENFQTSSREIHIL